MALSIGIAHLSTKGSQAVCVAKDGLHVMRVDSNRVKAGHGTDNWPQVAPCNAAVCRQPWQVV